MPTALHRPGIDLRKAHTTAGHFGFFVSLMSRPGQCASLQHIEQPYALFTAELREGTPWIEAGKL